MKHEIEWIFSGIGVLLITSLITLLKRIKDKRYKQKKDDERSQITNLMDASEFISENPPDGINIKSGTVFEKQWTIRNSGEVVWVDRYLKCISYVPNYFYPEKVLIKMPVVRPGQKYTLKVKYYANLEGEYLSEWKMVDKNEKLLFPNLMPLGVFVRVLRKS